MVLHSLGPDVTLDAIVKGLPEKIRRMDKIVESKQFEYVAASSVINVPVPEVAKPNEANRRGNCPNSIIHYQKGFVGTSEKIVALKEDLFKELVIFEKTMDQLRQLALEYVPKEEDGNNTGVAIQQLARNHVNTYHAWAKARLSRQSDDFNDRDSLVDKIVSTPHNGDYRPIELIQFDKDVIMQSSLVTWICETTTPQLPITSS